MDDDENGLFNISLSDDEEKVEKVPRDFQSEEDFQKQRAEWTPTIETGQIWKSLKLPIDQPSKQDMQKILHAIEELYFLRVYEEALGVAIDALKGDLPDEFRKTLDNYMEKCLGKLEIKPT